VPNVQIAVGFGRKTCPDPPVVFIGFQIFTNNVTDKVRLRRSSLHRRRDRGFQIGVRPIHSQSSILTIRGIERFARNRWADAVTTGSLSFYNHMVANNGPDSKPSSRPTVLSVTELSKSYSTNVAVDRVTFAVNRNEIVGLLGPNGAGKTTTINMVL